MKKILFIACSLSMLNLTAQISGSGTTNYIPKFTGTTAIGNGIISQGNGGTNSNLVGIGTTSPRATIDIVKQCGSNNLAGLLMEYNVLSPNCASGQTYGSDYVVIRQFNSWTSAYLHFFYINSTGKVAVGSTTATTQLDVQAISSNDPFQVKNNGGTTLFKVLASGNTGIGTATPAGPLDIRNSSGSILMQLNSTGNVSIGNISPTYRLDVNCQQTGAAQPPLRLVNYAGNTNMIVNNSDRVGINVTNPDTYGGSLVVGAISTGANALDLVSTATSGWCNQLRFDNASGARYLITDDRTNNYLLIKTGYGGGATAKLRVEGNQDLIGDLAVTGTASFASTAYFGGHYPTGSYSGYTVGVYGDFIAKKVVVETGSWSDKVFADDYNLTSIADLEHYIKANNHLPEIPTECEVLEKGVDVGEMNKLLLQKVEELTLYVIAQQKQIDNLGKK